ncbi:MAG: sulfatase-like hydrolase/transferase [Chthoniobacterales bacterium]
MTDTATPAKPQTLIWASCWLAVLLVAAKACSGIVPWWPHLPKRLVTLIASSWSDVLFALSCGLIGALVIRGLARWPRVASIARVSVLVLLTGFVVYAVATVGLFRYFHRPLTFDMFGMVGNAGAIRSSLWERVTLPIGIAFLLAPAIFLFLAARIRRGTGVLLALAFLWILTGWLLQRAGWESERLQFLRLSPHAELLRTVARGLAGGQRPSFSTDFPAEYLEEFRTFRARGTGPRSHFQLPPGVARPKNVIVVVLESIGTKYLRLYGNPIEHTPTLTAEAKNALVFENIYAHASFTYASFRPINFSVYPGLPWHYALLEDGRPLPETLAARMKMRGARTAYITSGDLYWGEQHWLLERENNFDWLLGAPDLGCPLLSSWGTEDRCAIDRLVSFVEQSAGQPFFAVCWTDQTHDPYLLGAAHSGAAPTDDLDRYLAVLQSTDVQLARVFATLRERGLADDTLVVVTGDHGEAFGDTHGQRGHAWSVYEEEVHVPFMIWNPRLFPEGGRVATIGGHVDLNPTLTDLLDLEPAQEWQGHSLFNPARPERAYFMAIAGGSVFGVREGDWKYFYEVNSGRESLFNLATDPKELHNLSDQEKERAAGLRQRVAAWVTFEEAFLWGREN